jgi:hypothetical protein
MFECLDVRMFECSCLSIAGLNQTICYGEILPEKSKHPENITSTDSSWNVERAIQLRCKQLLWIIVDWQEPIGR